MPAVRHQADCFYMHVATKLLRFTFSLILLYTTTLLLQTKLWWARSSWVRQKEHAHRNSSCANDSLGRNPEHTTTTFWYRVEPSGIHLACSHKQMCVVALESPCCTLQAVRQHPADLLLQARCKTKHLRLTTFRFASILLLHCFCRRYMGGFLQSSGKRSQPV